MHQGSSPSIPSRPRPPTQSLATAASPSAGSPYASPRGSPSGTTHAQLGNGYVNHAGTNNADRPRAWATSTSLASSPDFSSPSPITGSPGARYTLSAEGDHARMTSTNPPQQQQGSRLTAATPLNSWARRSTHLPSTNHPHTAQQSRYSAATPSPKASATLPTLTPPSSQHSRPFTASVLQPPAPSPYGGASTRASVLRSGPAASPSHTPPQKQPPQPSARALSAEASVRHASTDVPHRGVRHVQAIPSSQFALDPRLTVAQEGVEGREGLTPQPLQLRLSRLSVGELDLRTAQMPVGPLVLRGVWSGTAATFCTEDAWPTPHTHLEGPTRKLPPKDWMPVVAAAWPSDAVHAVLPTGASVAASEPRSLVVGCYVRTVSSTHTPLRHGQDKAEEEAAEELFVGGCEVAVEELTKIAGGTESGGGASTFIDLPLRDSSGAAVGCLSFDVALLPMRQRSVRVGAIQVLPDPLQADDEYARHKPRSSSGGRPHSGSENGSAYAQELVLTLAPPLSVAMITVDGVAAGEAGVTASASSRSLAAVRWDMLPLLTYFESPVASDSRDEASSPQQAQVAAFKHPQPPLLTGALYYCPSVRHRNLMNLKSGVPPPPPPRVLLGTFAVPQPPRSYTGVLASHRSSRNNRRNHTDDSLLYDHHDGTRAPLKSIPVPYHFEVPLRTSEKGGQWMAMGDCWVRGVLETWAELTTEDKGSAKPVNGSGMDPLHRTAGNATAESRMSPQPPPPLQSAGATAVGAEALSPPDAPSQQSPWAHPPTSTAIQPAEEEDEEEDEEGDVGLRRVRERQEALIQRVEHRLTAVQQQRRQLQEEIAAQAAHAHEEENAIAEEFGLLESQQREAEVAYQDATEQLEDLQQYHAGRTAEHDAYLFEQQHALAEVARERQEAEELRHQLEVLQVEMVECLTAERQRCAARVARALPVLPQSSGQDTQWLTHLEGQIAAAESGVP